MALQSWQLLLPLNLGGMVKKGGNRGPLNSWIYVRLEMPEDSIWETKVSATSMANADSQP